MHLEFDAQDALHLVTSMHEQDRVLAPNPETG
jgi:hypothetical protein